jgi:hypothetical protein
MKARSSTRNCGAVKMAGAFSRTRLNVSARLYQDYLRRACSLSYCFRFASASGSMGTTRLG